MKPRELENLGIPRGEIMRLAVSLIAKAAWDAPSKGQLRQRVSEVIRHPDAHHHDAEFGELARALIAHRERPAATEAFVPREAPAPWRQWGADLEAESVQQMSNACELPVS